MTRIQEQYDAYPYPERDPADEASRLVTGSPSHPAEMDHCAFAGRRDWSQPMRILVAGGGTGDGLIQLATMLTAMKTPHEILYLDLSVSAREIAEARAKVRGLTSIRFETGDLLSAAERGAFDYIDCCGVLHHLPDPQAGFDVLAGALAPDGALGLMVYAPLGRSGVYPLQAAFSALAAGTPKERLAQAKAIFRNVPEGHPFKRNPHLLDHEASDAGFYDLLLHSQDVAMTAPTLLDHLDAAGLRLSSFAQPALYDLLRLLPRGMAVPSDLEPKASFGLAEALRGTIKVHVAYAVPKTASNRRAQSSDPACIPNLKGVKARQLAQAVANSGRVKFRDSGSAIEEPLDRAAAPLIAGIDGRRSLGEIAHAAKLDPIAFNAIWGGVDRVLGDWGLMWYSGWRGQT